MKEMIKKVEEWSRVRRLDTADPKAQALKVIEEFTEMMMAKKEYEVAKNLNWTKDAPKELKDKVIDGVGDTYVTLIILCQQLRKSFEGVYKGCAAQLSTENGIKAINELATGISKGHISTTVKQAVVNMVEIADGVSFGIGEYPKDCLEVAYNEIKDRKGMMIHGSFVKYDDLSPVDKAVLDGD